METEKQSGTALNNGQAPLGEEMGSLGLRVHQVFGDHELVRLAGRGAMAEVWLGLDPYLQRYHAIKLMRTELYSDEGAVERFYHEARSIAKLNHPNIVQVHRVGQENEIPFFIMEWIDGESLLERLNREGPLPFLTAYDIVIQVIDGLSYACDMGIVHRDIKPNNIMIVKPTNLPHDKRSRVKIADFGLALEQESESATGKSFGSPGYMSPEAVLGQLQDHRSDIYSLGITFYHMLTGQIPYITLDRQEMMRMHLTKPLPEPKALRKTMNGSVMELLHRMTAKDPNERFATYEALRAALEAVAASADRRRSVQGAGASAEQTSAGEEEGPPPEIAVDTVRIENAIQPEMIESFHTAAMTLRRWNRISHFAIVILIAAVAGLGMYLYKSRQEAALYETPKVTPRPNIEVPRPSPSPSPAAAAEKPLPGAAVPDLAAAAPASGASAMIRAAYQAAQKRGGASPTPMSYAAQNMMRAALGRQAPPINGNPTDFVIESRRDGMNNERYREIEGVWIDSNTPARTAKSSAPGCSPMQIGSRKSVFSTPGEAAASNPSAAVLFLPLFSAPGHYYVYTTWPKAANAAPVYYTIRHANGDTRKIIPQDGPGVRSSSNANSWISLGDYDFNNGPDQFVEIRIKSDARPMAPNDYGQVFADTVRFTTKQDAMAVMP